MVHQHQVKKEQEYQKMVKIATSREAKKVYKTYILSYVDSSAFQENSFVKKYTVDKNSLDYNPMGGLMVKVILNNNSDFYIDFNLIDNEDGTYHSAYYSESPKLADITDKRKEKNVK